MKVRLASCDTSKVRKSSSQLIFVLLPETVSYWKELPGTFLVHFPHIRFLEKTRRSQKLQMKKTKKKLIEIKYIESLVLRLSRNESGETLETL